MRGLIEIQTLELSNDLKVEISIFDIDQKKIQIHSSIKKPKIDLISKRINIDLSLEKSTKQQSKAPKESPKHLKHKLIKSPIETPSIQLDIKVAIFDGDKKKIQIPPSLEKLAIEIQDSIGRPTIDLRLIKNKLSFSLSSSSDEKKKRKGES
jgi:hypothetical protein